MGASLGWLRRRWDVPEIAASLCWDLGQRSRQLIDRTNARAVQHFCFSVKVRFSSDCCRYAILLLAILVPLLGLTHSAFPQISPGPSRALITQPINENALVTLSGNTRPEARNLANDRGIVPDGLPMSHMLLQLRRPAAQEQALDALID